MTAEERAEDLVRNSIAWTDIDPGRAKRQVLALIHEVVAEEREACARVADDLPSTDTSADDLVSAAMAIAAAIRARTA